MSRSIEEREVESRMLKEISEWKHAKLEVKAAYAIALRDRDLGIVSDEQQLIIKIKNYLMADKLKGRAGELARLMNEMGIGFSVSSDKSSSYISFFCDGETMSLVFNEDGSFNRQTFTNWKNCTSQGEI